MLKLSEQVKDVAQSTALSLVYLRVLTASAGHNGELATLYIKYLR